MGHDRAVWAAGHAHKRRRLDQDPASGHRLVRRIIVIPESVKNGASGGGGAASGGGDDEEPAEPRPAPEPAPAPAPTRSPSTQPPVDSPAPRLPEASPTREPARPPTPPAATSRQAPANNPAPARSSTSLGAPYSPSRASSSVSSVAASLPISPALLSPPSAQPLVPLATSSPALLAPMPSAVSDADAAGVNNHGSGPVIGASCLSIDEADAHRRRDRRGRRHRSRPRPRALPRPPSAAAEARSPIRDVPAFHQRRSNGSRGSTASALGHLVPAVSRAASVGRIVRGRRTARGGALACAFAVVASLLISSGRHARCGTAVGGDGRTGLDGRLRLGRERPGRATLHRLDRLDSTDRQEERHHGPAQRAQALRQPEHRGRYWRLSIVRPDRSDAFDEHDAFERVDRPTAAASSQSWISADRSPVRRQLRGTLSTCRRARSAIRSVVLRSVSAAAGRQAWHEGLLPGRGSVRQGVARAQGQSVPARPRHGLLPYVDLRFGSS